MSMGLYRAGFDVVGVDIADQPNYPFEFHRGDCLTFPLDGFDVYHASVPCQGYAKTWRIQKDAHPDLIAAMRERLRATGKPYVLENVPGAPLLDSVELCGTMFGLGVLRHRLFESNMPLIQPEHPEHRAPQVKMGRGPKVEEYVQVVGHFANVNQARAAMGIHWMTRDELAESIPPAYGEWVGRQLLAA